MNFLSIFEEHKSRNIFFAALSFLTAFVTYTLTVAPTTSFWDPAEYIAISHTLQIAHPPGSPFFALVGRVVSMFVPAGYVALSINMISVTVSAFTIMFLYLVIVRLIIEWKGAADEMSVVDQIGMYGGGLIGALTFTFTHTQWFNAVESEMYASSMFFTALVVWLAMKWAAVHDKPYSERWLILIAYVFGIGIGVHLLNLLAIFFVGLIIYFKKYTFSITSFSGLIGSSVGIFLLIYPVTIINLPNLSITIRELSYGLITPVVYLLLFISVISYGVYYTQKKKMRLANIFMLCYAMIIIGYSSYALIIIRSQANPPIDENDPSSVEAFISYLSRDQYGTSPLLKGNTYNNQMGTLDRNNETLFPRRHSTQQHHHEYYSRFNSDLDFFLRYQVNHMYLRYFNWNFIGREADIQDTGWYSGFSDTRYSNNPANSPYFFLPFLLGLFGMLYHFKNDWRRALSVLALFALTGLAIIFYLNQTPFEPRERDYAYVGSFFAFSIWLGFGATAMIDLVKQTVGNNRYASYGVLGLLFLSVPTLVAYQNYPSHDRSERYVARDYAYNLLQSVEPNAILFTNGDNDTFPLWYLQEVEGIRTDVRVVVLSLLNTDWYIKQMRDRQTHESLPLPIDLTDEEIRQITQEFNPFQPQEMAIPVNKDFLKTIYEDSTGAELSGIQVTPMLQNQIRSAVPFSLPVEELDDEVSWYLEGRLAGRDNQGNPVYFLQPQDHVVLNMLENNRWLRPIYFANTVSTSGQLGLEKYFQFEGKAFRIVPKKRDVGSFGHVDPEVHADRLSRFEFNNWNSPTVYFDENIRRMLGNYRYGFMQLADAYFSEGDIENAAYWLKYGEDKIPFRDYEHNLTITALYAYRYMRVNEFENAFKLSQLAADQLLHNLEYDFEDLKKIEGGIEKVEGEARQARSTGNMNTFQSLQNELQRLSQQRENIVQDVSFIRSQLSIVQNTLFEIDRDDEAAVLAEQVRFLSDGRLELATNREESNELIRRFGLDI